MGNTGTYIAHTKSVPTFSFPNTRIKKKKKLFKMGQGSKKNETRKKQNTLGKREKLRGGKGL